MPDYHPPYTITPAILNRVIEIGELLGRWSAQAEHSSPNQEIRNAILAYEKLLNWQSHRLTEICFPDAKINAKFLFTFLRMT
ncbi:Restriction modification system DNA specificity domain:Filamentation induced by cAMP protein Fic (fragment) [Xenorhabdus bovienii str. puntauvense]|uniref:Restriction modification system DNA specificity domain:Filamentation induced by cAMP protein Fic n=1 Tax=Xenorhabdus bovienii str. puntauvense TaxID=1398201 RepID=A0A077NDE0_XENBV